jgi:glutamate carboxypeptidase
MKRRAVLAGILVMGLTTTAHAEPRNDALWAASQACQKPAMELLNNWVSMDSGSANRDGVSALGANIAERFKAIGASVEMVPSTEPQYADMVVARFKGTGRGKVLLIPHMDTVFSKGVAKPIVLDGDKAIGPGAGDDKNGIVAAYCAMVALHEVGFQNFDVVSVLVNSHEETGSRGSKALIQSESRHHDVVYVLEGGLEGDAVKIMRKGSATIHVDIVGKAAHAGVEPHKGRNALLEASQWALQLPSLANLTLKTTVNPTLMSAGTVSNVIPDHATLTADVRVQEPSEIDRLKKDLAKLPTHIDGVNVNARMDVSFPPFPDLESTHKLAAKAQAIYQELGLTLGTGATGGAGDAGYASEAGAPVLDGLGFVGGSAHTENDYVEIHTIAPRIYLLSRMIQTAGEHSW